MACKRCGRCCKYLYLLFSETGHDDKWIEGRYGFRKGHDVFIESRCKWLTKDNLCEIYKDRPEQCRRWPKGLGSAAWVRNMGCRYFD